MRLIPFKRMQKDLLPNWSMFDDFIDKFFHDDFISDSKLMAVDVIENEDNFKIKANLPGVKKEDIKIFVKENQLIIEAKHEEKKCENNTNIIRSERYVGKYQRLFTLPDNCDKSNIKAKIEHGVLELSITKMQPAPKLEIVVE